MIKTVSFSKNVTNIFFHILTKCNLKCMHCYINPEQHGTTTLSLSTIISWLKLFAKCKKKNIIFLGGEPTLHPELSEIIKTAKNLGFSSITVDTNGYLFNNILMKVEPCDQYCFSFSLDGATRKTNDMIRGKGSYDKCTDGIIKAVSRGFNTSLIYTVSAMNIHELHLMKPLLKNLGVKHFFIQVIGIRGKPAENKASKENHSSLQVPHSQWINTIPDIAQKISETGITVSYPKVYLKPDEQFECAGLVADNYFIFPNGRVYQCPICEDFPVHSMEIKGNRLMKTKKINEKDLFKLNIPEGCVMNRIVQPENITYQSNGQPEYKIACCLIKEEIAGKENKK